MKKLALFFILIVTFSCAKGRSFYDIEGAKFSFFIITGKNVLFQFSEPLKSLKIITEKGRIYFTENKFPKSNFIINSDFFSERCENITIYARDTSENRSKMNISSPIINTNPATIEIAEVQFRYGKKSEQNITLKSASSGSVLGYKFVIFQKNKKIEIDLKDETIKTNDKVNIKIIKTDEDKNNENISFCKKSVNIYLKNRLSQSNGLLYILDNNNEIVDCLLYYDSKKNDYEKLKETKGFKGYLFETSKYNYKPYVTDIKGHTTKKKLKRTGKYFVIRG